MQTIALLYHDVVPRNQLESSGFPGADANIYKLDCDEFRRQLEQIARVSEQPVTLFEPAENGGRRLLLTFDDGGVSAVLHTAGMLEEFGWRGHFFITSDRIGTSGFVNEGQILELHRRGHVIGSHSCSHPARMSHCSMEQLEREWAESIRRLSDIVGAPVVTASVPGGYYSREVAAAAARGGVRVLFTSEPVTSSQVVEGCTVLGRFGVQQGVSTEWVASVVSGHVMPRLSRYVFWNSKKALKAIGGESWLRMRRKILERQAEGKT
jgi:peptidoglycan/xylan/chitin deacetylase (PgdA/CDA1 family)